MEVKAPVEGVWFGTLVDCSMDVAKQVALLVSRDGNFHILPSHPVHPEGSPELLSGVIQMDGNTFRGSGLYFALENGATGLWIDGHILEADRLEGRWGADWGGFGYYHFEYSELVSVVKHTFRIAGIWDDTGGDYELQWRIDEDGRISGEDTSGCQYRGQVAFAGVSGQPIPLTLAISGCPANGNYSGMIYWNSGEFWDRLLVSVDDGASRSLSFELVDNDEKRIPGIWVGSIDEGSLQWRIGEEGLIAGEDESGCQYAGQVSFEKPEGNRYQVRLAVTDCSISGNYSGLIFWSNGPFEPQLIISTDDGAGRALELTLYGL